MAVGKDLTGLQLFALARRKAVAMGLDCKGLKLAELVPQIQKAEGNEPCYRMKEICYEAGCCWQKSCAAEMRES